MILLLSGRFLAWLGPFLWMVAMVAGCQAPATPEAAATLNKIDFDLTQLDDQGLYGPADGKRALDYEFCIPAGEAYGQAVTTIDPSLKLFPGRAGRLGCTDQQVLAMGNTHQPRAQLVLQELANLDYIHRIARVDWE